MLDDIRQRVTDEMLEINQSRSDFQLAHFVAGRHGTLEDGAGPRIRYQCLRELRACLSEIERMDIERERATRKIERLKSSDAQDADLDIREAGNSVREMEVEIAGKVRETYTMMRILDVLPRYTIEEFQAHEPQYWLSRLTRQVIQSRNSSMTGIDRGDIEAIGQASGPEFIEGVGRLTSMPIPDITQIQE